MISFSSIFLSSPFSPSSQFSSFWQKISLRIPPRTLSERITFPPIYRFSSHVCCNPYIFPPVQEVPHISRPFPYGHSSPYIPYRFSAVSQSVVTTENMPTLMDKKKEFFANGRPTVVGHRGLGMNTFQSQSEFESQSGEASRKLSILENTILSLNAAAAVGVDFVEFDVQVTKDGHPVIFHDDLILTDDGAARKIEDITLEEFSAIGPQKDPKKAGFSLLRRGLDGTPRVWSVDLAAPLCSLAEAFQDVIPTVGFNLEVKFSEDEVSSDVVSRMLDSILATVENFSNGRKLYFSSFNPDAVVELKKRQTKYPVFFLTEGGACLYKDERMNSVQSAIELSLENHLDGIVSEVKTILDNPSQVKKVKEANLMLFTYGELNNNVDSVRLQNSFGVDGIIVDNVSETVSLIKKNMLN